MKDSSNGNQQRFLVSKLLGSPEWQVVNDTIIQRNIKRLEMEILNGNAQDFAEYKSLIAKRKALVGIVNEITNFARGN